MKILQINNCDTKGGAARVGFQLCRGLIERGHEVLYLVAKKHSQEKFIKEIEVKSKHKTGPIAHLSDKIIYRLGLDIITVNKAFPFSLGKSFIKSFDLIHLHDVMGGYFNIAGLIWLSRQKPVAWTLHTMWPFTGACLYSYDCERWKKSCGKCPQFGKFPLNHLHRDASSLAIKVKKLIYKHSKLVPVGASKWISNQAQKSSLGRFKIETVQNLADTTIFHPMDKKEAKIALGIPPEARTIMFSVASKTEDKRKGLEIILKALPLLQTKNIFLIPLTITPGSHEVETVFERYPSLKANHIENDTKLNLLYNAADVFWHPSLADNAPLGIFEALASGTPVVTTRVGGVKEIIIDGENGFLVEPGNPQELAKKTDILLADDKIKQDVSKNARKTIETHYSQEHFLGKYENIYRKSLENKV